MVALSAQVKVKIMRWPSIPSCCVSAIFLLGFIALLHRSAFADSWVADLGNGNYKNPVLFADYSDPDLVKVGSDFYMVASSFNAMPGIPILHSKDLVNWQIIGHVYQSLPFEKFDKPAHGHGSWAPSIRYHNNTFYVYFCTPHTGLFVATAKNPAGPWKLEQMASVELWEDPSPFWDDDGKAYLVRGKVRADILYMHEMSADGKRLLSDGRVIYKDLEQQPVIEGPKMFKRDGYYYILAPAGGVQTGWQAVLRSKNIYGPYEAKTILHQGNGDINGPHQGGLLQLDSGEWWFMHFQDRDLYGRVVHLQPVQWKNAWPEMGVDTNNDGIGEPVTKWVKPNIDGSWPIKIPQTTDEFNLATLGLQWQWHANPKQTWYQLKKGKLKLNMVQNLTQNGNLRFVPNLLLQKFSAPTFTAITKIKFKPQQRGDKSGLVIMGQSWAYLALYQSDSDTKLGMFKGHYEQYDDATEMLEEIPTTPLDDGSYEYYLQARVEEGGKTQFYYSLDNKKYSQIGEAFQAEKGVWIGAKVGLFALNSGVKKSEGAAYFDWFLIE